MLKGLNSSNTVEKYVIAYIVKANLICLSLALKDKTEPRPQCELDFYNLFYYVNVKLL